MKIIIGGAGTVGYGIATSLASEGNDVTIIDQDKTLVDIASNDLDVRAFHGHLSDPDTLEAAGAADADMLIAVTLHDEINIMACKVAHVLFSVPVKIARMRRQSYLQPSRHKLFNKENLPIDLVISPEVEVGKAVVSWLEHTGALENISFCDRQYNLVSKLCDEKCPVLGTPLRELSERFDDLLAVVVAIARDNDIFAADGDQTLRPGDIVYFISPPDQVHRTLGLFGHEGSLGGRLVIAGGGNVGYNVVSALESFGRQIKVRVIDASSERASFIAEKSERAMVFSGSALDRSLLIEAEVNEADAFLALTNNDQINFLSTMAARDMGCASTLSLLNNTDYHLMMRTYGLGSFVNPRSITISRILQHIRSGRIKRVHPIENGKGEIIEAEALETSSLVGRRLAELGLEHGIRIGGIIRDGKPIMPKGDTRIQAKDQILLFALGGRVKKAEQLFRVGIDYFG